MPSGYPVMQALIERGVVGDFRAGQEGGDGHLLRFGFTPLYTRFVDAWDAAERAAPRCSPASPGASRASASARR